MSAEMQPLHETQIPDQQNRIQRIGNWFKELRNPDLLVEAGVLSPVKAEDTERSITGEFPVIDQPLDQNQIARAQSLIRNNPSVYGPNNREH